MYENNLEDKINYILDEIGKKSTVVVKRFIIGKDNKLRAATVYINNCVNKDIINRDVLNPLMLQIKENLILDENLPNILCEKYIPVSSVFMETDIKNIIWFIKNGKAVIILDSIKNAMIFDVTDGEYRSISDPQNESTVRGSRECFIENLDKNISILRRNIKDKNLIVENLIVGDRSQTMLALTYIDDIIDKNLLTEVKKRLSAIDVDSLTDTAMLGQFIEDPDFSIFPQFYGTERPDIVQSKLMEGRIAILMQGSPNVITTPSLFVEFFHGVEDYYSKTLVACFTRILRFLCAFLIVTLPSLYLALIQFNVELIPINFINAIIQFRKGIALTPFLEILSMEFVVELLREGGLRLPTKVGQTLSIVGGIIIGNTAVQSKIVSPTTLLVVGITVICTFLIPSYEMSIALRLIRFPMLLLTNVAGLLGISVGWYFIIVYLFSLKSFNVYYFEINKNDFKDMFFRYPLWKMKNRPQVIKNNDKRRQGVLSRLIKNKR